MRKHESWNSVMRRLHAELVETLKPRTEVEEHLLMLYASIAYRLGQLSMMKERGKL